MKKLIIMLLAVSAMFAITAQAGSSLEVAASFFEYEHKIGTFGLYQFETDTVGMGLEYEFLLENFIGLQTEYIYTPDLESHTFMILTNLAYPLTTDLTLEPFIGAGAVASDSVNFAATGGIDIIYRLYDTLSVYAGVRYMYYDASAPSGLGATLGIQLHW